MRREHKLDVQVADRLEEFAGSDSARYKARKRLLARAGLRLRVRLREVRTTATNAVMLFGDVREVEEVREGAGERGRGFYGQLCEQRRQLVEFGLPAGS